MMEFSIEKMPSRWMPRESVDTDADGIGDNTDDDIDGDGVANASDEFPYLSDASVSIAIEASDLDGGFSNRFVFIRTELSAVDEPDFATGYRNGAYELDEDGSFTFVNGGDTSKGIWRLEDGLLRIDETQSLISFTQPQANWQNFDIEAWEAAGIPQLALETLRQSALGLIEETDDAWEMVVAGGSKTFVRGFSGDDESESFNGYTIADFVLDPSQPVQLRR